MIARVERWIPVAHASARGTRRGLLGRLPDVDSGLMLVTAALCALGLIMVYVASAPAAYNSYGNPAYFFERQALWLGLGTGGLVVCYRLDYHRWRRLAPYLTALGMVLLVAVLVPHIGKEVQGARRWIGFGSVQIQPSVIAQFMVLVSGAVWLEQHRRRIGDWRHGVLPYAIRITAVGGLVIMEKDLGSTLVVGVMALGMLVIAGARIRYLLMAGGAGLLLGGLLILAEPYRVTRMLAYLHPFAHAQTSGYQAVQALYALGSGGLFGAGFASPVPPAQWLPESQNDFIFAVVGQDLGLVGMLLVLLLFGVFCWRGFMIARSAPDHLGAMLAGGITIWIVGQALINIGGVTDTIPSTGVPLTFISYGGSSLALSLAATGILLNISARCRRAGDAHARADNGRGDRWSLHARGGRGGGAEGD